MLYRLNTIPIKIPVRVFVDIDKLILKLTWKGKGAGRANNTILKKKNNNKKTGGFTLSDFKHAYRSTIIKTRKQTLVLFLALGMTTYHISSLLPGFQCTLAKLVWK